VSRPQHLKAVRLRLIPAALGLGAVVALAGCSAGQVTETDTQVAAVNGASGDVKDVAVRDATFTFPSDASFYPAGASAPMELMLANRGPDDRLVSVSSPYAASATVSGETTLPTDSALHALGGNDELNPGPSARTVKITLQGLKQQLGAGVTIPVTFTFEKAGQLTVQVPLGQDHDPRPEHGNPPAEGEGGEH
jgi:copper(I)-binding protein